MHREAQMKQKWFIILIIQNIAPLCLLHSRNLNYSLIGHYPPLRKRPISKTVSYAYEYLKRTNERTIDR